MSENRIRIREAIAFAKSQGKKIKKREFASLVFPYVSEHSAVNCLGNYERGTSSKMDRKQVNVICKKLGVDANLLFGTPPMEYPNKQDDNSG